jgi:hypothetical protein
MVSCVILCQQARADDPPAPSQPAAPTTAAPSSAEPSATPPAAEKPAAPGAIKPGVTVVGTKPELTPEEKQLIARGYKLEVRQGQRYFCRREQQIGSRFETKTCDTAQSIESRRTESQEALRVIQNDRPLANH